MLKNIIPITENLAMGCFVRKLGSEISNLAIQSKYINLERGLMRILINKQNQQKQFENINKIKNKIEFLVSQTKNIIDRLNLIICNYCKKLTSDRKSDCYKKKEQQFIKLLDNFQESGD